MNILKELKFLLNSRNFPINESPGIYELWIPSKLSETILSPIKDLLDTSKLKIENYYGEEYIALYIGASRNLRRTIQDIVKNVYNGQRGKYELTKIIYSLLIINGIDSRDDIKEMLDSCIIKWHESQNEFSARADKKAELNQVIYVWPTNAVGNNTISQNFKRHLKDIAKLK